jgi:hypothetical protein
LTKRTINRKAQRVSVYFWPNVDDDKAVLELAQALSAAGRTSDIMRQAIKRGLRAMIEAGDMPPSLVDRLSLKRRLNAREKTDGITIVPLPASYMPVAQPHPAAAQPAPAPYDAVSVAPTAELPPEPAFNMLDSLANLMPSSRVELPQDADT